MTCHEGICPPCKSCTPSAILLKLAGGSRSLASSAREAMSCRRLFQTPPPARLVSTLCHLAGSPAAKTSLAAIPAPRFAAQCLDSPLRRATTAPAPSAPCSRPFAADAGRRSLSSIAKISPARRNAGRSSFRSIVDQQECNTKRRCGRHRCNAVCCPVFNVKDAHPCPHTCGRPLKCGLHKCSVRHPRWPAHIFRPPVMQALATPAQFTPWTSSPAPAAAALSILPSDAVPNRQPATGPVIVRARAVMPSRTLAIRTASLAHPAQLSKGRPACADARRYPPPFVRRFLR